ncbi:thioesterase family protein [Streptomyces sp. NPDC053367]|uniref:thioesterase family protein n=1 Tax=Streptomyces sp. NPDC053367 TaxID=3365700 RepID=UPI0037D2DB80
MTVTAEAVKALVETESTVRLRPRYEGSNINTWIGFKHVNYLVEEAVLEHFRAAGLGSRYLFEQHGLGLDVADLDTRILHAFHQDDEARAVVVPKTEDGDEKGHLAFAVTLYVERDGKELKAVTSKVKVALRIDSYLAQAEVPQELARFAVAELGGFAELGEHHGAEVTEAAGTALSAGRGTTGDEDPVLAQLLAGRNAFGWKWRIPYPYCHFNERLAMSGYLRQVEEVVDLFLADRGISIKTLLDDRKWIPVVPHSRVQFLGEALMEEDLYTVFTVEEVFKDLTYTARTDFYVVREGRLVQTATGRITHGYAVFGDRSDWSLVNFDDRVLQAFAGRPGA